MPPNPSRRTALASLLGAVAVPRAGRAQADAWPSRPVRLVVPFASRGPMDSLSSLLARRLQAVWEQPVVVDYWPGPGAVAGTQFVAASAPDGYTLGVVDNDHMINPSLRPGLPYDTLRALAGVAQLAFGHYGLFAHPSVPVADVAGLLAFAKSRPGTLSCATSPAGTAAHLAAETFRQMAGLDLETLPHPDAAQARQAVAGARVPLLFDALSSSMPLARDGRLNLLALASPRRAAALPQVPLIADAVPGFSAVNVVGVIAPSFMPRERARRIGADLAQAARWPELVERMAALGMEPAGSGPDEYDALIREEIRKWADMARRAGLRVG